MSASEELPTVDYDTSWGIGNGEKVHYFNVGEWNMSSLNDEDANVEHAREAVKAWQAWLAFLESGEFDKKVSELDKNAETENAKHL